MRIVSDQRIRGYPSFKSLQARTGAQTALNTTSTVSGVCMPAFSLVFDFEVPMTLRASIKKGQR